MEKDTMPCIETPNHDIKEMHLLKDFSKKEKDHLEEFKITIGIINNSIKIIIKEGINIFNGKFNLNDLQLKDKYFKRFDNIEEAYKEILSTFNDNLYNIILEENNVVLNVEIEINNKKKIIPFLLQKSEIKNEDLIKSLYIIVNNYIKENNGLKEDIKKLNNKVNQMEHKFNSIENKIGRIINYINEKKEKEKISEKKLLNNFENVLGQSKIIENKEQISLIKNWLPYQNKNKINCKLIYDAKRDGDSASTFHSLCDYKGSTLTIISTSDNKKIGGFLSKSFGGNQDYISDNNAFLFSLNYNQKYPSLNQGNNYQDLKFQGPIFGSTSIYIENNFLSSNRNRYCSYTKRYDFGRRNNDKDFYFKVINLEIYQIYE